MPQLLGTHQRASKLRHGLGRSSPSALNSAEMGAAVEHAKSFLDMEKTGLLIVQEKSVIG